MKQMTRTAAVLTATAAMLVAGVTTASAAGRGFGGGYGGGNGAGMRQGYAVQQGYGGTMQRGMGMQGGNGTCNVSTLPSGTLTADQQAALAAMAGEEKLARDVYTALAAKFPALTQFARVAQSEAKHLEAVRAMLAKYGIADPTSGLAPGEFASTLRSTQYRDLLASAVDSASALKVGVTVEQMDMDDLAKLIATVTAPDVKQLLSNLQRASRMHLAAFSR